jgi:hypothetical protein
MPVISAGTDHYRDGATEAERQLFRTCVVPLDKAGLYKYNSILYKEGVPVPKNADHYRKVYKSFVICKACWGPTGKPKTWTNFLILPTEGSVSGR